MQDEAPRVFTRPWFRLNADFAWDADIRACRAVSVWPVLLGRMKRYGGFVPERELAPEAVAEEAQLPVEAVAAAIQALKDRGRLVYGERDVIVNQRSGAMRRIEGWTTPTWEQYQPDARPSGEQRKRASASPGALPGKPPREASHAAPSRPAPATRPAPSAPVPAAPPAPAPEPAAPAPAEPSSPPREPSPGALPSRPDGTETDRDLSNLGSKTAVAALSGDARARDARGAVPPPQEADPEVDEGPRVRPDDPYEAFRLTRTSGRTGAIMLSPKVRDALEALVTQHGPDAVIDAIDEAVESGPTDFPPRYLNTILGRWAREGRGTKAKQGQGRASGRASGSRPHHAASLYERSGGEAPRMRDWGDDDAGGDRADG